MGGVGVRDCVIDSVCCWCIGMSVWGGGGPLHGVRMGGLQWRTLHTGTFDCVQMQAKPQTVHRMHIDALPPTTR